MEPDAVLSLYWNIDVGKMYREVEASSQEPMACGVGVELGDALYVGGAGAGPKPGVAMPPRPPRPAFGVAAATPPAISPINPPKRPLLDKTSGSVAQDSVSVLNISDFMNYTVSRLRVDINK